MHTFIKLSPDNTNPKSFASQMRMRRFGFFLDLLRCTPHPVRILDIGGTQAFWVNMGFKQDPAVSIVLLNLKKQLVSNDRFSSIVGDATDLKGIENQSFDIVFSNSVIEHVGDFSAQQRMAQEVQRVGVRYFIQTPNYYFPIEPHFLVPGFQWYPVSLRIWLLRHFRLGWMGKIPDRNLARQSVEQIRLLSFSEMNELFPSAQIFQEKVFGMTKSFVAYSGWDLSYKRNKFQLT